MDFYKTVKFLKKLLSDTNKSKQHITMKCFYLAFICILFPILVQSQPTSLPAKITEKCYGNLLSDMTRSVCEICNVTDTAILNSIGSCSLTEFFNKRNDVLQEVVTKNMTLTGSDIFNLHGQIKDIKKLYELNLLHKYPEKGDSIISEFMKYDGLISALSIECIVFNRDTTLAKTTYSSRYPKGRFFIVDDSIGCKFGANFCDEKDILIADLRNYINHLENEILKLEEKGNASTKIQSATHNVGFCVFLLSVLVLIVLFYFFIKRYPKQSKKYLKYVSSIYKVIKKRVQFGNYNGATGWVDVNPVHENSIENNENESNGDNDTSEKKDITFQPQTEKFAIENNEWIIVGASVIGRGHVDSNMHCQDSNTYTKIGDGWGIAITSDGAGSEIHSHVGSKIVVTRTKAYFEQLILDASWYKDNSLPDDITWSKLVFKVLKAVRDDLQKFADGMQANIESFAATVIVVIHTPIGLLVAHIGDGRAGYQDKSGIWHSIITPHKGEEANQTIFITSDFWNIPFYEMSGISVPETRVIRDSVKSFVLMSDGCEHTSWDCNLYNADRGIYYDPNTPHTAFFNPLIKTLQKLKKDKLSFDEISKKWYNYLDQGNRSFINETDDKTMIIGTNS